MTILKGPNGGFRFDNSSEFSCCGCSAIRGFNYITPERFKEDYDWWTKTFSWHTGIAVTADNQRIAEEELKKLGAILISKIKNNSNKKGNLSVWQLHKPYPKYEDGRVVGTKFFGKVGELNQEVLANQRFDVERAFI